MEPLCRLCEGTHGIAKLDRIPKPRRVSHGLRRRADLPPLFSIPRVRIGHRSHLAGRDEGVEVRLAYPHSPSTDADGWQLTTIEPLSGLLGYADCGEGSPVRCVPW
jgi:hypothetical protein